MRLSTYGWGYTYCTNEQRLFTLPIWVALAAIGEEMHCNRSGSRTGTNYNDAGGVTTKLTQGC